MNIKVKFLLIVISAVLLVSCSKPIKQEEKPKVQEPVQKELSLSIVTTNKLLYNMVKDIVGERHCVNYMFTSKNKLWNFNYTEDSLSNISRKDLFFYWGSGLEPWSGGFVDKLAQNKVGPVSISRGIKFIEYGRHVKYKEATFIDNPYFWLNIDDYKVAMLNIKNSVQDKDSKNREFYEKNFAKALKETEEYQKKLKEAAEKLKEVTFVVDGDELDYFLKYYGFKTIKLYNYGIIPNAKITEENTKAEAKLNDLENAVFLYDNEEEIKVNEPIINKYKLKTTNIVVDKDDIRYIDILSNNLKSLETLISVK